MFLGAIEALYQVSETRGVSMMVKLAGFAYCVPSIIIRGRVRDLPPDSVNSGCPPFGFFLHLEVSIGFEVGAIHNRGRKGQDSGGTGGDGSPAGVELSDQ